MMMMKTAHLILVHKNPIQVERMLKRMYHPSFDFYIHVDKKVDIKPFTYLKSLKNVYFIKDRVRIIWGGHSLIQAGLNGIRQICKSQEHYNFINFLSGQDYPIKPIEEIAAFFQNSVGKEFLQYKDIVKDWKEAQGRYKRYHLTEFRFKGSTQVERVLNLILPVRKMPYDLHPYGESVFWMLSPEVALYVLNRIEKDSRLESFFKYMWGGDELLFQTLILNSPFRDRVVNNNYRYIDWSEKGAHPKVFGTEDFDSLAESPMLFARKFDITRNKEILDLIDLRVLGNINIKLH